ncbi:Zinc finger C2H2-type [Trinorchestia longiramus]|nr:Zinc finger C2H2-type [Trinorchestia longiramus]
MNMSERASWMWSMSSVEKTSGMQVNSPDDVSIVNVRVPSITSVSHQQSSNQTNPSLSFGCCNSNSKCTRKRLRFANEESANFDSSQNNASNFLQNTSSEDDLNRNGSSIGRCCRLCGKNFESLQWHPNHDSDLCHFSGSPSNVGGSGRCKYCLCCNSNGRCWAVQAFENCNSDSNIGMAQCMHCTDQGKYKNKSYINPNSLSRNNSEYSPPSSAALLKSSPKNQAKRINQLHPAPKTFDHQLRDGERAMFSGGRYFNPFGPDSTSGSRSHFSPIKMQSNTCVCANAGRAVQATV